MGMRRFLAERLRRDLRKGYDAFAVTGSYSPDAVSAGQRALRNMCLASLMVLGDAETRKLCVDQLRQADNMTDALTALTALGQLRLPGTQARAGAVLRQVKDEPLVVDKWLGVEAMSRLPARSPGARTTSHRRSACAIPTKFYALLGGFGPTRSISTRRTAPATASWPSRFGRSDPINRRSRPHGAQFRALETVRAKTSGA